MFIRLPGNVNGNFKRPVRGRGVKELTERMKSAPPSEASAMIAGPAVQARISRMGGCAMAYATCLSVLANSFSAGIEFRGNDSRNLRRRLSRNG